MSNYHIDTNSKRIEFIDNRFYKTDDGQYVPSVTTILQAYPKDAHFFQWLKQVGEEADTIRDEAGRRGSIVHSLTEIYDAGDEVNLLDNLGNIKFKMSEWAMFERYVQFRQMVEMNVILSEFHLINPELGYAGTLDRVAEINGCNYLIDIKTSNSVYEHYWLQLAAYRRLIEDYYQSDKAIDGVAILWLNAKTRTTDAKKMQGPGWQLLIRDEALTAKDLELFNATYSLWKHQNDTMKPRNLNYSITHKLS
jgi:hypothetical protein